MIDSALDSGELLAAAHRCLLNIEIGRGGGAGVIWRIRDDEVLIATCAHVVRGVSVRVAMDRGPAVHARVVARDRWRDTALLAAPGDAFGDREAVRTTTSMRAGELVAAVGHPLGLRGAVSMGVLHSVDRVGHSGPARWIRADVRLQPGNSGGPLLDAAGRLLGLNALVARGLAHAVPAASFSLAEHIYRRGPVLGAELRAVIARDAAGERFGLLVLDLTESSPGARAGLLTGDLIVAIDGHPLASALDLSAVLATAIGRDRVALDIRRGENGTRLDVPIAEADREDRAA